MKPIPIVIPNPGRADAGVIYVAYGDKAREMCAHSIASLRSWHSNLPVCVISDRDMPGADVTRIEPDLEVTARSYKTRAYEFAPWKHCLYLDADTEVIGSLQGGFTPLAFGWEMCLAIDCTPTIGQFTHVKKEEARATVREIGTPEAMQLNSGMIFFRKCRAVERFYALWNEEWQRWGHCDQAALVRALYRSPAKLWVLGEPWNSHKHERATHIMHYHHRARREGAP